MTEERFATQVICIGIGTPGQHVVCIVDYTQNAYAPFVVLEDKSVPSEEVTRRVNNMDNFVRKINSAQPVEAAKMANSLTWVKL